MKKKKEKKSLGEKIKIGGAKIANLPYLEGLFLEALALQESGHRGVFGFGDGREDGIRRLEVLPYNGRLYDITGGGGQAT